MKYAGEGGGAGWYVDPIGRYPKRYWDGSRWTASVLDMQNQVAVDYLGTPVDAPPPVASAGGRMRPDGRPFLWGVVGGVVAVLVLVAAVLISDRRATDHTDKTVASQASDMSDAIGKVHDDVSDLGDQLSDVESQVADLSDQLLFDFSDLPDFTDFSGDEPPFDACDLLTPADVDSVLGATVSVDGDLTFRPYNCAMTTPAAPDGVAVFVRGDALGGDDLEDVLDRNAPGGVGVLTPVDVGDKGYLGVSFGVGVAAAAKGDYYVEIEVLRGGGAPTAEQLTQLLQVAISHM